MEQLTPKYRKGPKYTVEPQAHKAFSSSDFILIYYYNEKSLVIRTLGSDNF